MNYQIITDEKLLREFIDWLPDLRPTEKYYLCLFARSKYCKDEKGNNIITHIKSDKAQLKRFVYDKDRLLSKIKQLECPLGAYMQKDTPIPQEALALYISVNPRDMWKATARGAQKLVACLVDNNISNNPHQEILSEIQRTKGTTHYVDFDFDFPKESKFTKSMIIGIKEQIKEIVNPEAVTLLRTRGGIHCLVNPKLVSIEHKNSFYKKISGMGETDQAGDQLIPVPGTYQGGFTPHFINL